MLVYENLARKFNRHFEINPAFNHEIELIATAMLDTLALKTSHSPHYFYMHLSTLEDTHLLYYKEIHDLLKACVVWLLERKSFSTNLFDDMMPYYDLLPLKLQFLFSYAKMIYDYHLHNDSNILKLFIDRFQNQTLHSSMEELYYQITIYHQLVTHQFKKNGF